MKRVKELSFVYLIGAAGYSLIEILWRGFTHWTMTLTGGACFLCIYITNAKLKAARLWERCLIGSGIITTAEFCVGCVVNIALKWNVWDYSSMHFNLLGQICPLYSALWFVLCAPVSALGNGIQKMFLKPQNAKVSISTKLQ